VLIHTTGRTVPLVVHSGVDIGVFSPAAVERAQRWALSGHSGRMRLLPHVSAPLRGLALTLVLLIGGAGGSAAPPQQAAGFPWQWPVPGAREVVAPFRAPAHQYGPGHRGMDIAVAAGGALTAPAAGVVAFRGTVVDRPLITIDHGDGHVSTWEPVASTLRPGDTVHVGEVLGVRAAGGHAAAGTVHIGVRHRGEYINPLPLFGTVPRAVLLPCCRQLTANPRPRRTRVQARG